MTHTQIALAIQTITEKMQSMIAPLTGQIKSVSEMCYMLQDLITTPKNLDPILVLQVDFAQLAKKVMNLDT
jgi:hypothetical protein